jgi:uncharacterized membrane protein
MNPLRSYFVRNYGSPKGYLLLLMQVSVIVALFISMASLFSGPWLMLLEIFPAALLAGTLVEFRKKWRQESASHVAIFGLMFAAVLAVPAFTRTVSANPIAAANQLVYALIFLLLLLIGFRLVFSRRAIEGVVILSDHESAVVQTDYDLLAGVKAGRWVVQNRGAKKGQKVRISVNRSFFGQPRPGRILGVVR